MDFFQKTTFFESPITQKRFIFEESHILYSKRQKSCTLIVVLVILSYLTSPIFNSSSKSTGYFICRGGSTIQPYNVFHLPDELDYRWVSTATGKEPTYAPYYDPVRGRKHHYRGGSCIIFRHTAFPYHGYYHKASCDKSQVGSVCMARKGIVSIEVVS